MQRTTATRLPTMVSNGSHPGWKHIDVGCPIEEQGAFHLSNGIYASVLDYENRPLVLIAQFRNFNQNLNIFHPTRIGIALWQKQWKALRCLLHQRPEELDGTRIGSSVMLHWIPQRHAIGLRPLNQPLISNLLMGVVLNIDQWETLKSDALKLDGFISGMAMVNEDENENDIEIDCELHFSEWIDIHNTRWLVQDSWVNILERYFWRSTCKLCPACCDVNLLPSAHRCLQESTPALCQSMFHMLLEVTRIGEIMREFEALKCSTGLFNLQFCTHELLPKDNPNFVAVLKNLLQESLVRNETRRIQNSVSIMVEQVTP